MDYLKKIYWLSRFSFFIIYFWFGILKIFQISPAEELVKHLFELTISELVNFELFCFVFGLFECFIGILWLIPKVTKQIFYIYLFHFLLTLLPLLLLLSDSWNSFFIPTLVGQYIIKNLALLSLALYIYFTSSLYERD